MTEILYNDKIGKYTLKEVVEDVKSYKRVPIKYKPNDSTSRFRRDILDKKIEE